MTKELIISAIALIIAIVGVFTPAGQIVSTKVAENLGNTTADFWDTAEGYKVDGTKVINGVGGITQGGTNCTLTDANGGTYTLTDAEMEACGQFTFAAGGGGQAAIALTFPATSTMTTTIPNAGQCRTWFYDAGALAVATTTTMTAGAGHNIIAYTNADDVIDGLEYSEITMCRVANGDVNTFVSEMLAAD
jgi:hypothetical protein